MNRRRDLFPEGQRYLGAGLHIGRLLTTGCVFLAFLPGVTWLFLFSLDGTNFFGPTDLTYRFATNANHTLPAFPNFSPSTKKGRIALCAKLDDETPYLIEWIEFHRLQGVDKFALYPAYLPGDPLSAATAIQLEAVQTLYGERGMAGLIELHPTVNLVADLAVPLVAAFSSTPRNVHRQQQHALLAHCAAKYRKSFDYLLHIDLDEFMYAVPPSDLAHLPTLWSWLQNEHGSVSSWREFIKDAVDPLQIVGVAVESTQMGSAGILFDPHTQLDFDLAAGRTQIYFDPRDSREYQRDFHSRQKLKSVNPQDLTKRYFHSTTTTTDHDNNTNQTDGEKARETLKETDSAIETETLTAISSLIQSQGIEAVQRLSDTVDLETLTKLLPAARWQLKGEEDSPHLFAYFVAPSLTAAFAARFSPDSSLKPTYFAPGDSHNSSSPPADVSDLGILQATGLQSVNNFEGGTLSLSVEERKALGDKSISAWMKYFPLISSQQTTRRLRQGEKLTEGVGFEEVAKLVCPNDTARCDSDPSWMTAMGKSIYITSTMERNEAARKSGTFHGCALPWVHYCAHQAGEMKVIPVSPSSPIRLDHHQFRSFERRTTKLPAWRGGPVGYADRELFVEIQKMSNIQSDLSKSVLSDLVRKRIEVQFAPVPKFFNYSLITSQQSPRFVSSGSGRLCSAMELLHEAQIPCPASHPHVGMKPAGEGNPSTKIPYMWCAKNPPTADPFQPEIWLNNYKDDIGSDQFATDVIMCPGWPESRCCDSLNNNQSIWDSTLKPLVTDRYTLYQTLQLP